MFRAHRIGGPFAVLEAVARRAETMANSVNQRFQALYDKLTVTPHTIEQLVEKKDYITTVPKETAAIKPELDAMLVGKRCGARRESLRAGGGREGGRGSVCDGAGGETGGRGGAGLATFCSRASHEGVTSRDNGISGNQGHPPFPQASIEA